MEVLHSYTKSVVVHWTSFHESSSDVLLVTNPQRNFVQQISRDVEVIRLPILLICIMQNTQNKGSHPEMKIKVHGSSTSHGENTVPLTTQYLVRNER